MVYFSVFIRLLALSALTYYLIYSSEELLDFLTYLTDKQFFISDNEISILSLLFIMAILNDFFPLLESNALYFDKTVRFRLVVFALTGAVLFFDLLKDFGLELNTGFTDVIYYYSFFEVILNSISLMESS